MREIRPYGSEGGARFNSSLLPLSFQFFSSRRNKALEKESQRKETDKCYRQILRNIRHGEPINPYDACQQTGHCAAYLRVCCPENGTEGS
jgi:hypothetical protein